MGILKAENLMNPPLFSIVEMFARAKEAGLKGRRMRILFEDCDSGVLQLSMSAPKSDLPPLIWVAEVGAEKELGGFDLDGEPRWDLARHNDVVEVLESFVAHPIEAAAKYGARIGRCMFCNHELTLEVSMRVGFGPDCAPHWGLPYE